MVCTCGKEMTPTVWEWSNGWFCECGRTVIEKQPKQKGEWESFCIQWANEHIIAGGSNSGLNVVCPIDGM